MIGASIEAATVTSPETLCPFDLKSLIRLPSSGRSVATTVRPIPEIADEKARLSRSIIDVSRWRGKRRARPERQKARAVSGTAPSVTSRAPFRKPSSEPERLRCTARRVSSRPR